MAVHPDQPNHPTPNAPDHHDLRTHLTVIKGYTQLAHRQALRAKDTPASLIAYLETVLTHIDQMVILLAVTEKPEPPVAGGKSDAPT